MLLRGGVGRAGFLYVLTGGFGCGVVVWFAIWGFGVFVLGVGVVFRGFLFSCEIGVIWCLGVWLAGYFGFAICYDIGFKLSGVVLGFCFCR